MTKLHEVLAAEATVVGATDKLLIETLGKFGKHSQFFSGSLRTLKRLGATPEDEAQERAGRVDKPINTSVKETLAYVFPFVEKSLGLKLAKHETNQAAVADIELGGKAIMTKVPVDFLLDLEQAIPKWRNLFLEMPTLDPGRKWKPEGRPGVYVTEAPVQSVQDTKVLVPLILTPATPQHPAQVKEVAEVKLLGLYDDIFFSGCATTEQKAQAIELCDQLIVAVKQARMRANSTEVKKPQGIAVVGLFAEIFR